MNKMSIDKVGLNRLPPKERIEKLRLMEEERQKEATEIERLIKESMQELRTDKLAEEVAPEPKPVDISRLFEATGEQRLERTAREEAPPVASMKGNNGYILEQISYAYSKLKEFYATISRGGSLTGEQGTEVVRIRERVVTAERYKPPSEEVARILDASKSVLKRLEEEAGLRFYTS